MRFLVSPGLPALILGLASLSAAADTKSWQTGDNALGGVVFYTNSAGTHGLVAATRDQQVGLKSLSEGYTASNVCSSPTQFDEAGQEYTDWRLPEATELYRLHQAYTQGLVHNFKASDSVWYKSRTQLNQLDWWNLNFKTGKGAWFGQRSGQTLNIRCIRSF